MQEFYGTDAPGRAGSDAARIIELVSIRGFADLPAALSPERVRDYCERLDAVYERQKKEFGDERLRAIGENNVARCPLAYDSTFLDLVQDSAVLQIVHAVLGSYVVLHLQNGIIVHPNENHRQAAWHRDLPYQEFVSSRPLAVNVFFCLEDFNQETGGTMFLPFSHRSEKLPSTEVLESLQEQPRVSAGSAIIFDSMLFHRAGRNTSTRIRRGINQVFTMAILRQQLDIPGWLPEHNPELHARAVADPQMSRLLGYDARTADNVLAFRQRRFEKLGAR